MAVRPPKEPITFANCVLRIEFNYLPMQDKYLNDIDQRIPFEGN